MPGAGRLTAPMTIAPAVPVAQVEVGQVEVGQLPSVGAEHAA
jgi:hypothetical protein